ncbi:MAG: formylglycine-generating enzyme family protein [Thermoanaerobaculia bacterium]
MGSYLEGRGEYPVSGVSWYEAAACAEWAGSSLPTIFHWNRVALPLASSRIVPLANLASRGPVPVASTHSANRYGVEVLAGNVREWTWNRSGASDDRFLLGGGWSDPDHAFADAYAQSAFDRSPTDGFRSIHSPEEEPNRAALARAVERPSRDFRAEKPVDDALFAQYLWQFAYDKRRSTRGSRRRSNSRPAACRRSPSTPPTRRPQDGVPLPAARRRRRSSAVPGGRDLPGLGFQRALPEVDAINYITRVKQPTLILNGELDFFFAVETSQRPMFELLGTLAEDKKRLVFPGGHSVPRTEMMRESLAWLDRYRGPVEPR